MHPTRKERLAVRACLTSLAVILQLSACGRGAPPPSPTPARGVSDPGTGAGAGLGARGAGSAGGPVPTCTPGDPRCNPPVEGVVFDIEERQVAEAFQDIFRFTTEGQKTPDGLPTVVVFPHRAHATARLVEVSTSCRDFPDVTACTTCHHKDLEEEKPRRCSECHKADAPDPPEPGAPPRAEVALHLRCIGCHKAVVEACDDPNLKNVAVQCEQCHKAPTSGRRTVRKIAEGDATPVPGGSL